jgi:hypothetical protein
MAPLSDKIEVEMRMRELLEKEGMPLPDEVEYGHGCIRLFWTESKVCVVVDIDDYTEVDADRIEAPPKLALTDPVREGREPPFTVFPHADSRRRN